MEERMLWKWPKARSVHVDVILFWIAHFKCDQMLWQALWGEARWNVWRWNRNIPWCTWVMYHWCIMTGRHCNLLYQCCYTCTCRRLCAVSWIEPHLCKSCSTAFESTLFKQVFQITLFFNFVRLFPLIFPCPICTQTMTCDVTGHAFVHYRLCTSFTACAFLGCVVWWKNMWDSLPRVKKCVLYIETAARNSPRSLQSVYQTKLGMVWVYAEYPRQNTMEVMNSQLSRSLSKAWELFCHTLTLSTVNFYHCMQLLTFLLVTVLVWCAWKLSLQVSGRHKLTCQWRSAWLSCFASNSTDKLFYVVVSSLTQFTIGNG